MGNIYFDESIRDKGQFIIGCAVYSNQDLSAEVDAIWKSLGLPSGYEFKSSASKAGDTAEQERRSRLYGVLQKGKIGLVVCPTSDRKALGSFSLALIEQLRRSMSITQGPHTLYLDQEIDIPKAEVATATATGLTIMSSQDSRIASGIQLADLAAHSLGGMLLEQMGLLTKKVRAGENSGYDPDLQIEIGFELWANLRYWLFRSAVPIRTDDPTNFKVEGYGLYIAPSCSDVLRMHARNRFGENYLGCIH